MVSVFQQCLLRKIIDISNIMSGRIFTKILLAAAKSIKKTDIQESRYDFVRSSHYNVSTHIYDQRLDSAERKNNATQRR